MNIPLCNFYPFMYVKTDEDGKPTSDMVTAVNADILTVVERMNFSFNFIFETHQNFRDYYNKSIRMLAYNEANLIPIAVPICLIEQTPNSSSILTLEFDQASNLVGIVPIIFQDKLYFPSGIVLYLCAIPACIVFYCLVVNCLKIYKKSWKIFNVLKLLFGIPIHARPHASVDRITFAIIVLFSIPYSVKFYSTFLNIEMVHEEIPLNTLKDIDESGLDLSVNSVYWDYVFGTDNVYIRNMERRTRKLGDIASCVDDLAHGHPSVCITVTSFANYYAERYVNAKGKPIMKVVKAVFYLDKGMYAIEQASPYYGKIKMILMAIQEAGISKRLKKRQTPKTVFSNMNVKSGNFVDNVFLAQLVSVLGAGYATSLIAFLIEMITQIIREKIYLKLSTRN